MILDTNAVSSLLDGDKQLSSVLENANSHHLPLVVLAEYLFGLRSSKKGSRLVALLCKLESDSRILFPNRETADWYASIRFDLKQRGCPIPEGDLWIAALARQYELEIVSRDEHFDLVRKVRRIGW